MATDTGENTYQERQSGINIAEERFERWCEAGNHEFRRLGFDEKKNSVPGFYLMHPLLRSLPDYCIYAKRRQIMQYFHVKGSPKIKIDDLILYSQFEDLFVRGCPAILRVAFCLEEGRPIFRSLEQIRGQLTDKRIQSWKSDGKQFITLGLEAT
jgi:hypothetical protein